MPLPRLFSAFFPLLQNLDKFLFRSEWEAPFWNRSSPQTLTRYYQALLRPSSDLLFITTGARTTAQDNHYVYILFGERHQPKIPPLLSHLSQVTSYPGQIYRGITGATILQGYLNFVTMP